MNLQVWNTNDTPEYNNLIKEKINYLIRHTKITGTRLLNIEKSNFDILEKYVYDLSKVHAKNLNLNDNNYYVEFWFKNTFQSHELHVDCDEHEKTLKSIYNYPLLSCLSYFNKILLNYTFIIFMPLRNLFVLLTRNTVCNFVLIT